MSSWPVFKLNPGRQNIFLSYRCVMVLLCFIRHAESVSNVMRNHDMAGSRDVRDPALSEEGRHAAEAYGPVLQRILEARGFDLGNTVFASSALQRAKQTLAKLFPGRESTVLPYFGEDGSIPENTPASQTYKAPNLNRTLRSLPSDRNCVIVGHGSFLTSTVWFKITETSRAKLHNLDAFIVSGDYRQDAPVRSEKALFAAKSYIDLPFKRSRINRMRVGSKTSRNKTRRNRNKNRNKTRRQRGGMSLGFFSPGAQMIGMSPYATGRGLEVSNDSWARETLART